MSCCLAAYYITIVIFFRQCAGYVQLSQSIRYCTPDGHIVSIEADPHSFTFQRVVCQSVRYYSHSLTGSNLPPVACAQLRRLKVINV